jgi:hypothetical protein
MKMIKTALATLSSVALMACASVTPTAEEAVDVEPVGVDEAQLIYNTNVDGTWSADALTPSVGAGETLARATFGGPSNKTRRMGVCLLERYKEPSAPFASMPCNTTADCTFAPFSLPSGGFRYCTSPNNSGQKYCYFRPGPATTFCAGTPQDNQFHPPGNYITWGAAPVQRPAAQYISYACFEGCTASDPSSSSASASIVCQNCGGICCE